VKTSLEEHRQSWSSERGSRADAIQRKPLPSSPFAESFTGEHSQTRPKSYPDFPGPVVESKKYAEDERHLENARHIPLRSSDRTANIARKPVGPRAFNSKVKTADSGVIGRKPVGGSQADGSTRQSGSPGFPHEFQSLRGERPEDSVGDVGSSWSLDQAHRFTTNIASDRSPPRPPLPPRPSQSFSEHGKNDFRVSVIRRDPTSGSQWNVGSLSSEHRPTLPDRDSLRIEITTPGYQKFARQLDIQAQHFQVGKQATAEHTAASTSDNLSSTHEKHASTPKAPRPSSTHFEPRLFRRDIMLNRSTPPYRPKSSHHHQRSNSSDSFPTSPSKSARLTSPKAAAQLTFSSPWHGTCTFTTGMDGRSLKCRHKLPSSNPEQSNDPVLVAELRFNLPWSALRNRDTNASALVSDGKRPKSLAFLGEDAKRSFKKGMARIRQEINPTSSDPELRTGFSSSTHTPGERQAFTTPSFAHDDTSDSSSTRLVLNLGRERAGGGRKGKSAKLGKLVLRDEGLKMADLVVAACMGVWWDVYEGGFGGRDT